MWRPGWLRRGKAQEGFHKAHLAVDTLGNLLALHVTPANEQDRDQVGQLAQAILEVSNQEVTLAYVDQGYTGQNPANAALEQGIALGCPKPWPDGTT
jgi:transposase